MISADMFVATAASHMVSRCVFLDILFHPKIQTPIKTDSRKKASVASMANGAPKISPTYREYSDQFKPNWNSMVIPVTTPRAKLIRNSLPQNLVIRNQVSSPVNTYLVSIQAVMMDNPSVSGTNIQ